MMIQMIMQMMIQMIIQMMIQMHYEKAAQQLKKLPDTFIDIDYKSF